MNKYLNISKMVVKESLYYRIHFISTFIGNMLFILVTYYLWRSIFEYSSKTEIGGLTCIQTIFYICCASALNSMLTTAIDSEIARHFTTGDISILLTSPLNYFVRVFFHNLGLVLPNFVLIFVPTMFVIIFVLQCSLSALNILLFIFALAGSIMINFFIDYLIGLSSFYTGNIWTIRVIKNAISSIFSGVVVPIAFFGKNMKIIAYILPFQAIYNTPARMLVNDKMPLNEMLFLFGIQILWVVILMLLSRRFYKYIMRNIEVNGG